MRLLLILLVTIAASFASADPVASVLKKLHKDPKEGFREAEQSYSTAKDTKTAARLATILAFAPVDQVKTAPYIYAQFAFLRDQTLTRDLKIKLAKLAGEGLFNQSQFKKAAVLFTKAIATPDLTTEEREYFEYQIAWCEINMKQPEKAYARMIAFLKSCPECRLHKEMTTDLGKTFALLKKPAELSVVTSDEERQAFVDGYVNEIQRESKYSLTENTKRFENTPLMTEWARFVFEDRRFSDASSCARTETLAIIPVESWPRETALRDLRLCTETLLKSKAKIPLTLLAIYQKSGSQTQLDLLLLSSLMERASMITQACDARLRAAGMPLESPARAALTPEIFLPSAVSVCRSSGDARVAGLLDLENFQKVSPQEFDRFISQIASVPTWRQAYESRSLDKTVAVASPDGIKRLLTDGRWSSQWREKLWAMAPSEVATEAEVISLRAKEAYGTDRYQEVIKNIESRSSGTRALVVLLKLRKVGAVADYAELLKVGDWSELSTKERSEILSHLVQAENVGKILNDWKHWKPLLKENTRAFQKLTGLYAASDVSFPGIASPQDAQDLALNALKARKENPAQEIPTGLLSDAKALNQSAKAHRRLKDLDGKALTLVTVEGALDSTSRAIQSARRHKWKEAGLAQMNRQELKSACAKLASDLRSAQGPDGESLTQLAEVVSDWEKKL